MAKLLCWELRPPIVAKCDQKRVLSSWVSYCCNMVPEEFQVEFSSVRHLNPQVRTTNLGIKQLVMPWS
ncbi:hypothetical protein JHK86_055855 [Glycine max]|nr:hypothetical protein JHK86_055855 [Glycine max]